MDSTLREQIVVETLLKCMIKTTITEEKIFSNFGLEVHGGPLFVYSLRGLGAKKFGDFLLWCNTVILYCVAVEAQVCRMKTHFIGLDSPD